MVSTVVMASVMASTRGMTMVRMRMMTRMMMWIQSTMRRRPSQRAAESTRLTQVEKKQERKKHTHAHIRTKQNLSRLRDHGYPLSETIECACCPNAFEWIRMAPGCFSHVWVVCVLVSRAAPDRSNLQYRIESCTIIFNTG